MLSRTPFLKRSLALASLSLFAVACNLDDVAAPTNPALETYAAALNVNIASMTKISDDLYIQDVVVGTGATAANGKTLSVTYTGYLKSGTKFDSNVGGAPFTFILGAGKVIEGWDVGLVGMKVGGKRRLVIGSRLGYGATGSGPIPPNSTLVFDVELTNVQ